MSMIVETLKKEKNRIEYMLECYYKIMKELPKGTLSETNRNGRTYYYLKYRDGEKVITKYLGKEAENIAQLVEKRKHTEAMIKMLKNELKIAKKALEGNI